MARHNFLLQRACKPTSDGNHKWLDTFTSNHPINRGYSSPPMEGRGQGTADQFGNDGFATLEEARKELDYFLKEFGSDANYRIIQVIS